jgi:Ca-activated chloride channel family protein
VFRFAHPSWFLLLPLLLAAAYMIYRPRISQALRFPAAANMMPRRRSWRAVVGMLLPVFFLIGTAGLITALARPQHVLTQSREKTDAVAIQMAVDISGSMEALDMSTQTATGKFLPKSRLDAVKEVFSAFIGKRPDDLIGLVSFGGYPSTLAPLTADHEALLHVVNELETVQELRDRRGAIMNQEEVLTAIGDGLATACARIREAQPTSKVVVLLTDGVSNTGLIDPTDAAAAAAELDIKVYTIGVGTQGEVVLPVPTGDGRYVRRRVFMELDEPLLRSIADQTGGEYFNVRDPKGLEKALERIDELERTEVERNIYHHFDELFPFVLLPSLFLVCAVLLANKGVTRRFL